ncbi:MAG TPA: hypothetical protein DHU69_08695 [Deltaproteobacteria bacterium]|nr:MAG: hypothetical protein A2090_07420 [Deltaproteobacteria bacterium GWD2_42_10]HAG49883.1 hypothetical protein [Deltaproteobacteria bacterium]HCY19808.1 hypothetical protein [Deltaproteobacteria bacterium]
MVKLLSVVLILLFGLVSNSVEVKAFDYPRDCKSDWEVSAFDILKMSDKELLDMYCDTGKKFDYNMEEFRKFLMKGGSEATRRHFREAIENCKYLNNKLDAAMEGRIKKGVYKMSDLKCLDGN